MDGSTDKKVVIVSDSHLGLFTLIGIILIVVSFVWWKGFPWLPQPQRFSVLFHDVAGLNQHSAVKINGMHVGSVEQMELLGPELVRVQLKITSRQVRVPVRSKFYIFTNGIVGARYVEIVLPDVKAGEKPPMLSESSSVIGVDPVRTEFIVNNLAKSIDDLNVRDIQGTFKTEMARLGQAAERLGEAADSFTVLSKKVEPSVQSLGNAADSITVMSRKIEPSVRSLGSAADSFSGLSRQIGPSIERVAAAGDSITTLSGELTGTSKRVNKILDNPTINADLRETVHDARVTAEKAQAAMESLNATIGNEGVRKDLIVALRQLSDSARSVEGAAKEFGALGRDPQARIDFKQIASDAKETMIRADHFFNNTDFGHNLSGTLLQTQLTLGQVEPLARRMNKILEKRSPFFHLLLGRPGHLKPAEKDSVQVVSRVRRTVETRDTKVKTAPSGSEKPSEAEAGKPESPAEAEKPM